MTNIININTWTLERVAKRIALWAVSKKFWIEIKGEKLIAIREDGPLLVIPDPKRDLQDIGICVARLLKAKSIRVWSDGVNYKVEICR